MKDRDWINVSSNRPTLKMIKGIVARSFWVTTARIDSARRDVETCRARHTFVRLARDFTNASLPQIASAINRHHTTAMHGIEQSKLCYQHSEDYRHRFERCRYFLIKKMAVRP